MSARQTPPPQSVVPSGVSVAPTTVESNGTRKGPRLGRWTEELKALRPRAQVTQGVSRLLPQFCFNRTRTALWRSLHIKIGRGSLVMGDILLSGEGDWSELFSVGENTYITGPLRINLGGAVHIGSNVNVGHDNIFLTVDHQIGDAGRRAGTSTFGTITIEDGAWIASRVTLLPGVTVGRGAVVAAGSVVASDVPPHTMVGGVPAKVIRKLAPPA